MQVLQEVKVMIGVRAQMMERRESRFGWNENGTIDISDHVFEAFMIELMKEEIENADDDYQDDGVEDYKGND